MRRRQRRVVVRVFGNGPLTFPRQLDVVVFSPRDSGLFTVYFGSAGKNRKPPSTTGFFTNKTAGRGRLKQGSGLSIFVFHRTSGIARRKYAANFGTLEYTALFMKRNRRYKRCRYTAWSACQEFAAYFRIEHKLHWVVYRFGAAESSLCLVICI